MPWDDFLPHLTSGLGVLGVMATTFWNADGLISTAGKKLIYQRLTSEVENPSVEAIGISNLMSLYFTPHMPALLFVRNVAIFSLSAFLILLLVYISSVPGWWHQLATEEEARASFIGQLFGNGLPLVFAVNYVGFTLYSNWLLKRAVHPGIMLAFDMIVKLTLFVGLTTLIYLAYAHYANAFTGEYRLALGAVGPTLEGAILFRNLTGVYFYSVAISSLPLFLTGLLQIMADLPILSKVIRILLFWLPFEERRIRALAIVLGIFFGFFAGIASLFSSAAKMIL